MTTPNEETAAAIASFVEDRLDSRKVPWLFDEVADEQTAYEQTRRWICDKIAEQTAETRYRNWRAQRQEDAVHSSLEAAGYTESNHVGTITAPGDLEVGTYVGEQKVAGEDTQKADVVFRPDTDSLVLVEAKAIGVALDSYEREKEIRDKAAAWEDEFENTEVVAVVEGGLDESDIRKLQNHVDVYFEHRLDEAFTRDMRERRAN